jgi:GAF domain-containing protein
LGSGKPVTVRNIPTDPAQAGGRPDALKYQYGAYVALPLLQENRVLGILVLFASETEAFEEQEVELLGTLSESLVLALGPGWEQTGTPE